MNIVFVCADNAGDWDAREWRCSIPARAIERSGRHSAVLLGPDEFNLNSPRAQTACQAADVIVVQHSLLGAALSRIRRWQAQGKVVIADIDGPYPFTPVRRPAYSFWIPGPLSRLNAADDNFDPSRGAQIKAGLSQVRAATTSSLRLAEDWRNQTDVYYLPDSLELETYQNITLKAHDGIILGWGGSRSCWTSLTESGLLAALQRVCLDRPEARVMICGDFRSVFDDIPLPADQKIYQPWVPQTDWARALAWFDIGLAPLHGEKDERFSWKKVLEFMVMKIPWVASEGGPYHDLRSYGWLVSNNANAWERVLLDMIDHLKDYKAEAARDAYLYGLSQNMDENLDRLLSAYDSISRQASLSELSCSPSSA